MPAVTDLEGFTYLQREQNGVLLGVYERNPKHWLADGPGWDYGMELIPEEVDRIAPELSIGFERFPALQRVGIKRWVNGGITFTPDGNPLVGPVPGRRNFWSACGVMAGFSQGAGIGLALANWIVDGDPGDDVFGMDITRFGPFATDDSYLRATTAQFYARRFLIAYPNEELPAGRPLKTSPVYPDLLDAGARCSVVYGLEVAQYFAPDADFEENLTWRRVQRARDRRRGGCRNAYCGRPVRDDGVCPLRGHRVQAQRRGSTTSWPPRCPRWAASSSLRCSTTAVT